MTVRDTTGSHGDPGGRRMPCKLEGGGRWLDSFSRSLDELIGPQVISAVDQALTVSRAA
jgi:hypothetical protein